MYFVRRKSDRSLDSLMNTSLVFKSYLIVRETRIAQQNPQTMATMSQTETQTRIRTSRV